MAKIALEMMWEDTLRSSWWGGARVWVPRLWPRAWRRELSELGAHERRTRQGRSKS